MSTHKNIDKICVVVLALTLVITFLFMNGSILGIQAASRVIGYENRLFDTSRVHTIDIVMDDWDSFIETCENEEYVVCAVVIDGESYKNVGIRAKGNTSLSQVTTMNSNRYSFKIEFDQYDNTKSYHGLDKLSLNNIIQDTTYMKDYLTYQLMGSFGVAAPLCSYVNITVNGEEWGLYLAVEGVEDGFLKRNYGSSHGNLYKPDSTNFGGGRGNGRNFNFEDFMNSSDTETDTGRSNSQSGQEAGRMTQTNMQGNFDPSSMFGGNMSEGFDPSTMFGGGLPEGFDPSTMFGGNLPEGFDSATMFDGNLPEGFDPSTMFDGNLPESFDPSTMFGGSLPEGFDSSSMGGGMGGGFGGMGSSDVQLKYIDDDPDSYANIFENAKTTVSTVDQNRLIKSLKKLSNGEDLENVVDIDEVLRYFVVHNFVVNGDSYTGSMVHNYYLYEENGQLAMIPWDYNLAYGTFQGNNAGSAVNDPIDTPLSVSGNGDRPMADWIFLNEEYTELYHQYFAEFLNTTDFAAIIDTTTELIAPYVEKDATAFYSYEEFEIGVATLREFCLLRAESVQGQLDGTIPSTNEGQSMDSEALIDASTLSLSDMGSMNMGSMDLGMGGNRRDERDENSAGNSLGGIDGNLGDGRWNNRGNNNETQTPPEQSSDVARPPEDTGDDTMQQFPGGMQMPGSLGGNAENGMNNNRSSGNPFANMNSVSSQQDGNTIILLAVSMVILLVGLGVAFKFKRQS